MPGTEDAPPGTGMAEGPAANVEAHAAGSLTSSNPMIRWNAAPPSATVPLLPTIHSSAPWVGIVAAAPAVLLPTWPKSRGIPGPPTPAVESLEWG